MTKRSLIAALGYVLLPTPVLSDTVPALACPQLLEQLTTLTTGLPVYKLVGKDERHFIDDVDRPAEIARLKKIASVSCSTQPKEKGRQEAEAKRLHVALSPECAVERDLLGKYEQPGSRESPQTIAEKRQLVAAKCPAVDTTNLWLVHWMGRSSLEP